MKHIRNQKSFQKSKLIVYKPLIMPVLSYVCKKDAFLHYENKLTVYVSYENKLRIFKQTILRKILAPNQDPVSHKWLILPNTDIYSLHKEPDIVEKI